MDEREKQIEEAVVSPSTDTAGCLCCTRTTVYELRGPSVHHLRSLHKLPPSSRVCRDEEDESEIAAPVETVRGRKRLQRSAALISTLLVTARPARTPRHPLPTLVSSLSPSHPSLSPTMSHQSAEGYRYVAATDVLTKGLTSEGVIQPPISLRTPPKGQYDVVVVGGGYAGLVSARDSALAGAFPSRLPSFSPFRLRRRSN